MTCTRRELLQQVSAFGLATTIVASPAATSAWAAPVSKRPQNPTLVVVYLRGGADPLSAVVPFSDKDYARHRPTLALPTPDSASADAVLPLDDRFGFNPRMKELYKLYQTGLCVPLVAVGSPHSTRSHFDAQDFMERGAPGMKQLTSGWLNRYLQETRTSKDANLRAVALQPLLPRSLRGDYPVLARPDQKAEQAMAVYAQLYTNRPSRSGVASARAASQQTKESLEEFGARTIEQLWELNQILDRSPTLASYPQTRFGRQMRDLAKLIMARRGLEVTAIDYGGWDHHIDEGPLNGQMARQLSDVSTSLGAFVEDLGQELMSNVLVLVMSEFGRTVKENNNRGTDHGHGGFMLAIGGKTIGKSVCGRWTDLGDDQLYDGRDLPVHTDYRIVFAEALQAMFGFDGMKLGMFPGYTADSPPLDFLQGT